jgi:hypothetical protein
MLRAMAEDGNHHAGERLLVCSSRTIASPKRSTSCKPGSRSTASKTSSIPSSTPLWPV